MSAARRPALGAVVFFLLLAATLAASVLVVRARTPDLVLEVILPGREFSFTPGARRGPQEARITFFVRRPDENARITIVDSEEEVVRTLDPSLALESRETVTLSWDGSADAGGLAKPGRYRLAVELPASDRVMVWPIRMILLPPADDSDLDDGATLGGPS